jgi:hypothetical protein
MRQMDEQQETDRPPKKLRYGQGVLVASRDTRLTTCPFRSPTAQ